SPKFGDSSSCRAAPVVEVLTDPLRDEPLPMFRIGDLEFLDRFLDGRLGVRRGHRADVDGRGALDAADPPLNLFRRLLPHRSEIACHKKENTWRRPATRCSRILGILGNTRV